jgi:hypothetical protein
VHAQVLRPRGAHRTARANAAGGVAFRLVGRRRHPEVVISRLHSWPARTPVNASLRPRGSPTHDLGPPWIATPSMSGVLIPFLMPVYPGAFPTFRATSRVQSLTPELSKGLEFDLVVLIDPQAFGNGIEGAVDRYVAMTRATQQLVILTRS